MKWTYPIVAFIVFFVLGFGLVNLLKEDLEVAPWAGSTAEEGRLISHTKNVTRLVNAGPADLHSYLKTAIPYEEAQTTNMAPSEENWQEFFLNSLKVNPEARHVIILSGGDKKALAWSLPGLYYAYFYGSPVIFYNNGELTGRENVTTAMQAYVLGTEQMIPDEILSDFKDVERISAKSPQQLALKLAEYRDEQTEFGWGREVDRDNGYFHYVLTTPDDVLLGLAALPYAKSNNATLLYAEEDGGISGELDRYAFAQRADWFVTPSEGPFRHFWVVSNRISYAAQARLDFALEKAEYASMGPIALGDMEALMSIFLIWGIASALFVWIHSLYFLPMVKMPIKIGWTLASLLLPVLGPVLYINSYRRPAKEVDDGDWRWIRSHNQQSATATIMGFGYGAPLMIVVGFILVWFGFPIFFGEGMEGPFFWLGAGMPVMMIAMYILAVLIAWAMVQYPMKKSMMPGMSDKKISKMAFITTALSMLAVSLGMMSVSWYMLMDKIPMMPKEDDILWFASMWLASFIGFLVAWPLNWIFIRKHLKPGNV
ncbi:DUF4396 domain-containing protein [Salinimicrobium tongyeongense]|uniref:DUF4396 domain-containing protein n=1 Tax=Salinimicrobium tongyeongense TaxID=2809707 RepID=A0ABY6NS81_9FLAO|nr:DUF4396 domain-containing protein [Salinimicrobium tongyeongense]UZH55770.1 DUF4396 domain-containing protein [Salinimicrobium tongyeongense]